MDGIRLPSMDVSDPLKSNWKGQLRYNDSELSAI
jgi:hypothetical protein